MNARNISISLLTTFCLATTACNTDSLCMPAPDASETTHQVRFDWSNDSSAHPAGMRIWFYPADWYGNPIPVDLAGEAGGVVKLESGHYHMIAYNNDMEWVMASGSENFETLKLTTREANLLEPLGFNSRVSVPDSSQRVASYPEKAWATSAKNVELKTNDTITLRPLPLHCHFTFTVKDVDSLESVAKASASISGMPANFNLSSMRADNDICTHPLKVDIIPEERELHGDFYTFMAPPNMYATNRMAFYIVLKNGKQYKFTTGDWLDVTQQVRDAPNPKEVHLVLKGLKLPSGDQLTEGEFDPGVDDWNDNFISIDI